MGRAYTEEDWQNMTVAERWNTDYDRMAYGWASEEEPRPAHLSDLGNSRMRELKKLQDTSHVGGKDNSFYTLPNPLNLTLGNTDNASNLLGSISKYIGDVSGFSDYIKDRDYARNQHIKDKRFQQAALSDGGITAYHPSNAPYNRNAKLRALQSGTFSRDPRTFKDDGTINSLGTASAKDVVLSKLMAEQNRMNNRVDNMFSNQVTDVGIPGYKPVQHTPNTGKFFDSMLSTAGSTREDFNKLTDEKKSKLRGLMSDYMLKYHGLPSGGGDSQGGSVPVMPQQDPLGKLNKLMYGNTPDAKRPNIGPLNEQGEFQKSDERVYSSLSDFSPSAIWNDLKKDANKFQEIKKEVPWVNTTVNNLEKLIGFETQEERETPIVNVPPYCQMASLVI